MVRTFALAALALVAADAAHACSCGAIAGADKARGYSDVVFEGTVVSKRVVIGNSPLGTERWSLPLAEYTFSVTRSWKGPATGEIRLRQGYDFCDNLFTGAETYLVFASVNHEDPTTYSSGRCGPTAPIAHAARSVSELGPPLARLTPTRTPLRDLNGAYFARLYFLSGVAAYTNVMRHPARLDQWKALGAGPFVFLASILATCGAAMLMTSGRGIAAAGLILVAVLLAVLAIGAAGQSAMGNGYFAHLAEWR